jgi:polyhydroxyalkanoate synthesis regulator phasin
LEDSKHFNTCRYAGWQGPFVDSGQLDPEEECMGCHRMRIQLGALSSTLTFELETLSQHRHLIERLQDESYAQRSQIEEQRSSMEIMQRRLDQLERAQQQPSNPESNQGASKNENSVSVNQISDLNEPHPEVIREQQQIKMEPGS